MRRNALLAGIVALVGLAPSILLALYLRSSPETTTALLDEDTGETVSGHGKSSSKAKAPPKEKHAAPPKEKHTAKPKALPKVSPKSEKTSALETPPSESELPTLKDLSPSAKPVGVVGETQAFPISVPKSYPPPMPLNDEDNPGDAVADATRPELANGAAEQEGAHGPTRRLCAGREAICGILSGTSPSEVRTSSLFRAITQHPLFCFRDSCWSGSNSTSRCKPAWGGNSPGESPDLSRNTEGPIISSSRRRHFSSNRRIRNSNLLNDLNVIFLV